MKKKFANHLIQHFNGVTTDGFTVNKFVNLSLQFNDLITLYVILLASYQIRS